MERPSRSTTPPSREELRKRLEWFDDAAHYVHHKLNLYEETLYRLSLPVASELPSSPTVVSGNEGQQSLDLWQQQLLPATDPRVLSLDPENRNRRPRSLDVEQSPDAQRLRAAEEFHAVPAILRSIAETRARANLQAQTNAAWYVASSIAQADESLYELRLLLANEELARRKIVLATRVPHETLLDRSADIYKVKAQLAHNQMPHVEMAALHLMRLAQKEMEVDFEFFKISPPQQAPCDLPPQAREILAALGVDEGRRFLDESRCMVYKQLQQLARNQKKPLLANLDTRTTQIRRQTERTDAEHAVEVATNSAPCSQNTKSRKRKRNVYGSSGGDAEHYSPSLDATRVAGAGTSTRTPSKRACPAGNVTGDNAMPMECASRTSPQSEALLHACKCWLERYLNKELTG